MMAQTLWLRCALFFFRVQRVPPTLQSVMSMALSLSLSLSIYLYAFLPVYYFVFSFFLSILRVALLVPDALVASLVSCLIPA